ncbi:MAG TPA: hypothetical protein DEA82_16305 [Flavobacteriaceae bacterium]|nr:hypothetical protein [Flavobacteriaceae bacterium]
MLKRNGSHKPTTHNSQPTTHNPQPTADNRQQTTDNRYHVQHSIPFRRPFKLFILDYRRRRIYRFKPCCIPAEI